MIRTVADSYRNVNHAETKLGRNYCETYLDSYMGVAVLLGKTHVTITCMLRQKSFHILLIITSWDTTETRGVYV